MQENTHSITTVLAEAEKARATVIHRAAKPYVFCQQPVYSNPSYSNKIAACDFTVTATQLFTYSNEQPQGIRT